MSSREFVDADFWRGKRVLITGHTGFKGAWLSTWLAGLDATVAGISLQPPFSPNLFTLGRLSDKMESHEIDIVDSGKIAQVFASFKPEIVLHLAAQSLVRKSYDAPLETYRTNVLGTLSVFEAARSAGTVRAIVNVTTDKCYENAEWDWGYRESDPLGGHDMYSSSKAASEVLTQSYRRSFFPSGEYGEKHHTLLASARAGNVIGGGDWSQDRILPDCFRAIASQSVLKIRNPGAVRPWQHVLEPLGGYLLLAQHLHRGDVNFATAFNFGPADSDARPVSWIVDQLKGRFPNLEVDYDRSTQPHEANLLRLDCSKARNYLGWVPQWTTETAIAKTCDWFEAFQNQDDMFQVTSGQIKEYTGGN